MSIDRCRGGEFLRWTFLLLTFSMLCHSCETYQQGSRIYAAKCANCHGKKAEGLARMYPPLSQSAVVTDSVPRLVCIITKGVSGPRLVNGVLYNNIMAPVQDMTPIELANLINYLRVEVNGLKDEVKVSDIEAWLEECN